MFALLLCILLASKVCSDLGFYRDTNAMDVADENLVQTNRPTISCTVATSHSYLAETSDSIMATFKGDFSLSGPHNLGSFPTPGSTKQISVMLNTPIGELQQVHLQKQGEDQWLLSHMKCSLGHTLYELEGPKQWLDVGGEANALKYSLDVPAEDTLLLQVLKKILIFTTQGLVEAQ